MQLSNDLFGEYVQYSTVSGEAKLCLYTSVYNEIAVMKYLYQQSS